MGSGSQDAERDTAGGEIAPAAAVGRRRRRRPPAPSPPASTFPWSRPLPAFLAPITRPGRRGVVLSLALAIVAGLMQPFAAADLDVWPLAWIALVPVLVVVTHAPTRRRAMLYGWVAGLAANLGGFYWLTGLLVRFGHLPWPVALLGLALLCGYQALVFWLFAAAVRRLRLVSAERRGAPLPMALVATLVMVTFELCVPFIFPWYLAITQAWVTPIIQIAELGGPIAVTALLAAVNGAIYDLLFASGWRGRWRPVLATALALVASLLFGFVRLHQIDARRAAAPKVRVGVVQGNIPFDEKGLLRPELAADQLRDLQRKSAELEAQGAELLLWTESAYPYFVPRDATVDAPEIAVGRIRRGVSAPLVVGAVTWDGLEESYPRNSALMLAADGRFTGRYDKIFLLMFGEYTPLVENVHWLRDLMPRNAGHFARGEDIVTFPFEHDGQAYRLGPMICYEDILPDFGRKLAALHPHLIVNITNDAWFGDTTEPWEHLQLSVFRAVEMRSDLVRAVNTGVSAFIDASGRVYARTYAVDPHLTPRPVDGIVAEATLMEGGHTLYAAIGDLVWYLVATVTGFLWLLWPRLRRRSG